MNKNIASQNPSDALDTVAKFHRIMEKAGVPWERFQLAINNRTARRNLAEYLNMGCPRVKDGQIVTMPVNDYDLARKILGKDFVSPEEVAEARKITYSDEVLVYLAETLPSEEVLQWLRDNDYVLVAGSPVPTSLLEIREMNNQLLYSKSGSWYAEDNQKFSRNDKVTAKWIMLRKSPVKNSTSKTWREQQELLSNVERVPNAAETVWVITTYKEVRNIWLFPDIYVRTSSVDSGGDHVRVGRSADGGIGVGSRWGGLRGGSLGLASARK